MSRFSSTASTPSWPRLILSARPFLGAGSVSKAADLDGIVRFSQPAICADVLTAAARRGLDAIMPLNDATLLRALDLAHARCRLQVYPIIPNVLGYVRDATDYGMVGAGLRHLRRLSPGDLLRVGLRGLGKVRRVMARDFRALLPLLLEVEMAAFKRFRPPLVLLHAQVTDLAVAFGNPEILRVFAAVIRGRFGAEPGLVTNNFGTLLPCLARGEIDVSVIVAPFNPKGFLMKPTKEACEALLRTTDKCVIADRIRISAGEPFEAALEYVQGLGIRSAVVDSAEAAGLVASLGPRHGAESIAEPSGLTSRLAAAGAS